MSERLTIELPFPPSVNHYWRTFRGRHVISAAGKRYAIDVQAAILSLGCKRFKGERLKVVVAAYVPDRRKRDLDNLHKSLLDACGKAGLWEDDEQIDDLQIVRAGHEPPDGRVILHVEPLAARAARSA